MRAKWNGTTIAESDQTLVIEGNHYFPPDAIRPEYFRDSDKHTTCAWKGEASYKTLAVDGQTNTDAAWFYPQPKDAAAEIKDYYAFWRGVDVTE